MDALGRTRGDSNFGVKKKREEQRVRGKREVKNAELKKEHSERIRARAALIRKGQKKEKGKGFSQTTFVSEGKGGGLKKTLNRGVDDITGEEYS